MKKLDFIAAQITLHEHQSSCLEKIEYYTKNKKLSSEQKIKMIENIFSEESWQEICFSEVIRLSCVTADTINHVLPQEKHEYDDPEVLDGIVHKYLKDRENWLST